MKTRQCLHCGAMVRGRIDKKFCDDACRATFNNKNRSVNFYQRMTDHALRKNRKILASLMNNQQGEMKLPFQTLLALGFNPALYTGALPSGGNQFRYLCYEYSFSLVKNEQVLLFPVDNVLLCSDDNQ